MESLTFAEVANLINKSPSTNIDTSPIHTVKNKCAIYQGVNIVPGFKYEFYILYLFSDATIDSIKSALTHVNHPEKTQIVYAESLDKKFSTGNIKSLIAGKVKNIMTTKDYLILFVKDNIKKYMEMLPKIPSHYVDPKIEVPLGIPRKRPNPLESFLDLESRKGDLAILFAEPGQGKTYVANYLAAKIKNKNSIPILINSNQWTSLPVDDLNSIWKTITNPFSFFGSRIDWIDGHEELFINTTLKAGIFNIVFDGFDEYILWNNGTVDPIEAIKNISSLAESCQTNIVLTTRTSFWNSTVRDSDFVKEKENIYSYELLPFDKNEARNYFSKRFNGEEKSVSYCLSIYEEISGKGQKESIANFAGRGFVLDLIADLVERSEKYADLSNINTSVMQWIMKSLCQREEIRQQLPLNYQEQLCICREIAEERSSGKDVNSEDLKAIIQAYKGSLTDRQLDNLVSASSKKGTLKDHPLIRRNANNDSWHFVHEQIYFNLLAEQIINYLSENSQLLSRMMNNFADKGSIIDDIAHTIIEQIRVSNDLGQFSTKIFEINKTMTNITLQASESSTEYLRRFSTKLILIALDLECPRGSQKIERTQKLLSILPDKDIKDLVFTGTLTNLDFSGKKFKKCKFNQVTISNCLFNQETTFEDCIFSGGAIHQCKGFGFSRFVNVKTDSPAQLMIEAQMIEDGKKTYAKENLRNDISELLAKFTDKGTLKMKSLHENNFKTGLFGKSTKKDEILKSFKKHIIEPHHVSGTKDNAYNIRQSAKDSVIHFFTNGVFTGPIAKVYEELTERLKV